MQYNVTLIDPANYKYAYLLTDTSRMIAYGLRSLGYSCSLTVNNLDASAINVIVGTHLLQEQDSNSIINSGVKVVVHQSEVLMPGTGGVRVRSSFLGDQFE